MQHFTPTAKNGFSLIEAMIAIALFVTIVMMGVNMLLSASRTHKVTQVMRAAMDSLNFAMEDMSRNVRLGSDVHCFTNPETHTVDVAQGCSGANASSSKLALEGLYGDPSVLTDQIAYVFVQGSGGANGYLAKSTTGNCANGTCFKAITPSDVDVNFIPHSGFTVTCSATTQALVEIRLAGTVAYQGHQTDFDLQTSVSPRDQNVCP